MNIADNPAYFPLFFVGMWALISIIIAHVGGWQELATVYRAEGGFAGKRLGAQSARMRWNTGYNNMLTIGVSSLGIRLSVFFPFRLAHPPLFIPWSEISTENKRRWLRQWVELRFARVSGVPLVISRRLAERIEREVGSAFPWSPPQTDQHGSLADKMRPRNLE